MCSACAVHVQCMCMMLGVGGLRRLQLCSREASEKHIEDMVAALACKGCTVL